MRLRIKKIVSRCKFILVSFYLSSLLLLFRFFPVKRDRVVFLNFTGKGYGDSGKAIADALLLSEVQLDMIWFAKKQYKDTIPTNIKYAKYLSPISLFYLATARVWISNKRFHYGVIKRKGQFYIQTWHSSLRLKKVEKDAKDMLNVQYLKSAKSDSKMIDVFTSGCSFSSNTYRNSFWYDGAVLECGTPRIDLFFDSNQKKYLRDKVQKVYNLDGKKKTILYAPTFRQGDAQGAYLNIKHFMTLLDSRYNVIVRLHPNAKSRIAIIGGAIDATKYPDMQELLCATDFLITDYSGCCFDALIGEIPCILYTPDLDEYLAKERSLYFSFDQLPFLKVKTVAELTSAIEKFNPYEYRRQTNEFAKFVGLLENGTASRTIANLILSKCKGEK